MDETQAQALGHYLRKTRKARGLSTTRIAVVVGLNQANIVRLEQGQVLNPDPDKLRAIAEALGLNLADLLEMAGYPIPTELPSMGPYLRTKYRNLPAGAVDEIQSDIAQILRRYGLEPNDGPQNGEDETPDDT